MSEIKVITFESNNTVSANNLFVANTVTGNSTGLRVGSNVVINSSTIAIGNSSVNNQITSTVSEPYIFLGENVFPSSNDVFAWVDKTGGVFEYNCTVSRDFSIERSPYGGIPMKITPSGFDPHLATYNSNTWNLAPAANGETWKVSGWVRANATINVADFLLVLPANQTGSFLGSDAGFLPPSVNLIKDTWTYFEAVSTFTNNANLAYMQIRLDGIQSGLYDTWYDGITVTKATTSLVTGEVVNTQIFTANGTWTKPSWATDGNELVIVHMWGGGGGGVGNSTGFQLGGGGGAFVFGYFTASQCNATCNVVVGTPGTGTTQTSTATAGGSSIFYANTTNSLIAYGGGAAGGNTTVWRGGGGGGWLSAGANTGVGGGPLGASAAGDDSTFGGGAGSSNTNGTGGRSIYGGGAGRVDGGGVSIYGGCGGAVGSATALSVYGGNGGNSTVLAIAPGGGGGANTASGGNGARGEVRIYTLRKIA